MFAYTGIGVRAESDWVFGRKRNQCSASAGIGVRWGPEYTLKHQLPVLPLFNSFWEELPKLFSWLHGFESSTKLPAIPANETINSEWKPPRMAQAWRNGVPVEMIRFAATNRLCISFKYRRESQIIEPYALRKSSNGALLLCGTKPESYETQTYNVNEMQNVTVEAIGFTPKFATEMASIR